MDARERRRKPSSMGPAAPVVKIKLPADLQGAALASGNFRLLAAPQQPAPGPARPSDVLLQQQLAQLQQRRSRAPQQPQPQPQPPAAQHRHEHHFDPAADGGSWPRRPHLQAALWRDAATTSQARGNAASDSGSTAPSSAAAAAAAADASAGDDPFGWVPDDEPLGAREPAQQAAAAASVRPRTAQIRSRTATSLPLELFDSPDMERPDLQARVAAAAAASSGEGLPAASRFYDPQGAFSWAPCTVLQHDSTSDQFLIRWQSNGRTKWVKRLNLIFGDEDRSAFRLRLLQAQRQRAEVEREARYQHYVSSLQLFNRSKQDAAFQQRVVAMAGAGLAEQQPRVAADYLDAACEQYKYAVNAAIVDYEFGTRDGAVHLAAAGIEPVHVRPPVPPQGCVPLQLLPPGCVVTVHTQPGPGAAGSGGGGTDGCGLPRRGPGWQGAAEDAAASDAEWPGPAPVAEPLPRQGFAAALAQLQRLSLLAQPRLLAALGAYQSCCSCVEQLTLLDARLAELQRPAQLGAFLALQRAYLENALELLQTDWAIKASHISDALLRLGPNDAAAPQSLAGYGYGPDDEGEGRPKPPSIVLPGPPVSPEQAFACVEVMTLLMQQHLRGWLEAGLTSYLGLWLAYEVQPGSRVAFAGFPDALTPPDPDPAATAALGDANLAWRGARAGSLAAWGADLFCPSPPPLFQLQLLLREGEDKGCGLVFVPSLEEVQASVVGLADAAIQASCSFENLAAKARDACSDATLCPMALDDPFAVQLRERISGIVAANLAGPRALLRSFAELLAQLDAAGGADGRLAAWQAGQHSTEETAAEIERLQQVADTIDAAAAADDSVWFRLVSVNVRQAKAALTARAHAARHALAQCLASQWHAANSAGIARFEAIVAALQQQPDTTEEMDALDQFMARVQQELPAMQQQIETSSATLAILGDSRHQQGDEAADAFWALRHWPLTLQDELAAAAERLSGYRDGFKQQLADDQQQLTVQLQQLQADVDAFMQLGGLPSVEERLVTVQDIEGRLDELQKLAELYEAREGIFQLAATQHPLLAEVRRSFEPIASLWRTAGAASRHLPDWLDGPFSEIDAEALAADVDKWWRATGRLTKQLAGAPLQAAEAVRQQLTEFQQHVPLIVALRAPGLRERHWERISAAVGASVRADAGFSLSRALQLGLPAHVAAIEEVAECASKEFSLEGALDRMQAEWAGLCFEAVVWRATGSTILRGVDDIQQLLDDQAVKTQAMRASPYIAPFEDRVRAWEGRLNRTQDVLDEWLRCQQGWLYLEPIFGSADIQQQMPNEGRKFKAVDATWRRIMERLSKQSEVLVVTGDEELLKSLVEANKLLEQVQKGLADYLETKRLAFPRFYFLSNDELLEILSETRDPRRVQPYLKKIFEGIAGLEFGAEEQVTAMLSEEGERVAFLRSFSPKSAGGAVERWLIECEAAMRDTVKGVLQASFEAYQSSARDAWMVSWPGQVVLAVDCIMWTAGCTAAILGNSLPQYTERLTQELLQVVHRVRGQLSKLERRVLSALIVIDVHARDVAAQLAAAGVTRTTDFDFVSQLRYGWESGDVVVRMINAALTYGYEYLGNSGRLVITPLTDRCYRTLLGALHLNLGGAPEGPAGTGKTETTKDLAKALAMQCVVFNCSDGLDTQAMGKFFKGLASSGAWACFDEFNRIDLEVLSVIAQQIHTMQHAKAAGLKIFEFEGTRLALRPTFSVFITMNPGYAGRSELPDNLKALFRSVAMMIPAYALISEISLYSSGYLQARDLARKLVATYQLCSEQLSSQSHYDYGMRAVVSVLRAAAANKQREPDADEGVLMLRSIRDVNEPKFLAPDVPLFHGILSDLFPGVELPAADYSHLDAALRSAASAAQLVATPAFMDKARQLYEMILVRHGLMLVGHSYGAKTSIYRSLAAALGELEAQGLMGEHRVQVRAINPKSITLGQLYGQFDAVSHEWKDGVLAKAFRDAAVDARPDRQWLLFDGPVDAVWIENMNTVLDDNKKLCLNSGEIIMMSPQMNLIFEVQDLAVASPATVSRCGMVYVEPSQTGWRPLAQAWLAHKLPAALGDAQRARLRELLEWLVDPCVAFVRKHCKELVATADISLPVSLMHLLTSLLDEWRAADAAKTSVKLDCPDACLDGLFAFSLVWSVGATCDRPSAAAFDAFLRRLLAGGVAAGPERTDVDLGPGLAITYPEQLLATPLPEAGSLYDYRFDKPSCSWAPWLDAEAASYAVPEAAAFTDILVPTPDSARCGQLLTLLAGHGRHVLFVGPTGTGKTVVVRTTLERMAAHGAYHLIPTALSAQTSANQVQDAVDAKLDKRRRGVYGPPLGSAALLFVDDLNMPALETYGAQPPVELLRQLLDHGGWYDRADNTWRHIADTQLVAAMGLPGGGRNPTSPRMLRHLCVIAVNEFDAASYTRVYTCIGDWWARRARLPEPVAALLPAVVAATLEVYAGVCAGLLPTPAKQHYTFNMRDLSKAFQGMQAVGVPVPDAPSLVRLWGHELLRVLHDRLVDDADRGWFCALLADMVPKHLGLPFERAFPLPPEAAAAAAAEAEAAPAAEAAGAVQQDERRRRAVAAAALQRVVFADFLQPGGAEAARYQEAGDARRLLGVLEAALADYNDQAKTRLDLVLFRSAAEHLARISRIIKQPYGNALLVGVGGSGRSSLTRLAAHIAEYKLFSIEISKTYGTAEWHEDLKKVLTQAGCGNVPTVFLFSDSQMKSEAFLEDVNAILNTGEVPNLFAKDELVGVLEAVSGRAKRAGRPLTPAGLWAFFLDSVRSNLHLVLTMSPVGDAFRERLRKCARQVPSLVSCTTIDWFSVWPADALKSVASKFLPQLGTDAAASPSAGAGPSPASQQLPTAAAEPAAGAAGGDALRAAVEETCMLFHTSVRSLADDYRREVGQHTYVTPTSYLELLHTYKTLLGSQQAAVGQLRRRYEVGLRKLLDAEAQVHVMQGELIALQPRLIDAGKEVEETLRVVDAQTQEAAAKKSVVEGEEAIAAEKAAAAKAIKEECEAELAVAMPMLESALAALNTLTKADITEVRSMKSPPAPVKVTLEAVCQLLAVKPRKMNDSRDPTKKLDDFWGPSQALMGDGFLAQLQAYDRDNIPAACIAAVRPYLARPEMAPETVRKASKAAHGLACWVTAMEAYDRVSKVVAPKRAALAQAEAEYSALMDGLAAKKAQLAAVVAALDELTTKLAAMQARKQQLEAEVELCQRKLERASRLVGGLGGEKTRWSEAAARLAADATNLIGDVLLAAGFIAYLGPYTAPYRERAVSLWLQQCRAAGIPCSAAFRLSAVLGDAVTLRGWLLNGLPSDGLSIDNALIISHSRRWPLMVDPQGQANKWLKAQERGANLQVLKLGGGGPEGLRALEAAVGFGYPALIEDVGEELDPLLEPLLLRATFKQGGVTCIRLGDATLEYSPGFRLYLTTKAAAPHYLPEVAVKVTLLNFSITREGLEGQLLSTVVARERPELEEDKARLALAGADNARQLKDIEDKIIAVLTHSEGNILEDESAVSIISSSKALANEIAAKQAVAARTERSIDEARAGYKPVAQHVSALFFALSQLAGVGPMYQFALAWFVGLFEASLVGADKARELPRRIGNITAHFTYALYCKVCRSLFERDKLLLSFLMAVHLQAHVAHSLDLAALRFLLTGGISSSHPPPNPSPWLSDKSWGELVRLSADVAGFEGLEAAFRDHDGAAFKAVADSPDPYACALPAPWGAALSGFQRLLLLRVLAPDRLVAGLRSFVRASLGERFVQPPPADLEGAFKDSSPASPLIFVLSPGSDPMAGLLKLAERLKAQVDSISLGQGQGPKAARLIEAAQQRGGWVVLQNCHLAVSWMPALERIVEGLASEGSASDAVHPGFRLWLTSDPSDAFPVAVLQAGIKMTNDPPTGLRQNLLASYASDPVREAFAAGCARPGEFQKLLYGLCFFHASVQERLKFGPLGWNVPYSFSTPDFAISARQLAMFINEAPPDALPLQALLYLTGECNYGGRVTDAHDRRTLASILALSYTPAILEEGYTFSPDPGCAAFTAPPEGPLESYAAFIQALPDAAPPEVFGLHANADIAKNQQETNQLLDSLLASQGGGGSGGGAGGGREALLLQVAADLGAKLRQPFDVEAAQYKFPVDYYESMNTVLTQELVRFNRLITTIHASLSQLQAALKGQALMSVELDRVSQAMFDGKVPASWAAASYPSLKPLGAFMAELGARLDMLAAWLEHGPPVVFWMGGFFFTHAFLTGVKQNFARRCRIPIDAVSFDFDCLPAGPVPDAAPPGGGAYVSGLFLDGARWDAAAGQLAESEPKVLFSPAPLMLLQPCEASQQRQFAAYECPLYRTPERRGVLATTGHSTNFVMELLLPSSRPADHWIRRGVAALLALAD